MSRLTRAMLLAAGRGERLQPLTDNIPKPLIPINNKPLIIHHIEKLAKNNIKNIIINISYLADQIKHTLGDGSYWGVNITYSHEPELLETGGGIYQALPLLGNKPFLVISSDIYTDFDFNPLVEGGDADRRRGEMAHLILVPNPPYHPKGDFSLELNGLLTNQPEYTYGNIALIHPDLFKYSKPGKFPLAPLLRQAVDQKLVSGELYTGPWANIGTLAELEKLQKNSNFQ